MAEEPETDLGEIQFPLDAGGDGGEIQMAAMTDATQAEADRMKRLFVQNDEFGGMPEDDDADLYPPYADPLYRMPDEIEVKVEGPDGDYYFPVRVEKFSGRKPYIGGFRNKKTGTIYHHGNSQTPTENKKSFLDNSHLRTRETQTYVTRTVSTQSYREYGTQMERVDCYIDNSEDRELAAGKYYTSTELDSDKRVKAIEIQRTWRGHIARHRAILLTQHIAARERKEFDDRVSAVKREKELLHRELRRKVSPASKLDFALLFNELETWRQQEVTRIKVMRALVSTFKLLVIVSHPTRRPPLGESSGGLQCWSCWPARPRRFNPYNS